MLSNRIEDFDPVKTATDREALRLGYVFDRKRADRPVKFIEKYCILTQDRFADQPFVVLPWQREILWQIFGWVHGETGVRRFREALVVVPKKNGKTGLLAVLLLYLMRYDATPRADVDIVATDLSQASILWKEAAETIKASPKLADEFTSSEFYRTIDAPETGGKGRTCSAEVDNKDGGNKSAVFFDELHLFTGRRRDAWRVYAGAGASRKQPLKFAISTAGHDRSSVLFELVQRAWRIEDGADAAKDDVHFYGKVYGPRDGEEVDPHDEATWRRFNPSLGHTITLDSFRADYLAARSSPEDFEDWKQRRLNIWGQPSRKFLDVFAWEACPPRRTLAEIVASGDPWFGGWDLASVRDLTAWVDVCGSLERGIDVFCHVWMPKKTAVERAARDGIPYLRWAQEGWIELVDEDVLNHQRVLDFAAARYAANPFTRAYGDFYTAVQFSAGMNAYKLPHKIIKQVTTSLGEPTKKLDGLVSAGLIRHRRPEDGAMNPVLTWALSNAVTVKDWNGNIRLDRDKSSAKIDPAAALVNAIAGLIDEQVEGAKALPVVTSGRIFYKPRGRD